MEPNELERFEAVVLPHLDAAFTLARYLTGDTQDAQDVVQDAALRAVKYFGGFRGADARDGRAWLLAIVRNAAHSWLPSSTRNSIAKAWRMRTRRWSSIAQKHATDCAKQSRNCPRNFAR